MRKIFYLICIILLLGLITIPVHAQAPLNCDADANGAVDIACGGTNATTAAQALVNLGMATAHNQSTPAQCITTNSGNAYTCTTAPTFTPAAGDQILIDFNAANTGTSTLAVNGASAATIKKWGASSLLSSGDLAAGHWIRATFDGTYWQLEGQLANGGGAHAQSSVSSPTYPNSTSAYTMQGVAGSITPSRTGNVLIIVSGTVVETTGTAAGVGVQYQLSYGTSTAPTSNAAKTGTQVGTVQKYLNPATVTAVDVAVPFSVQAVVTGLTVGTAYWIDLAAESITTASYVGFSNVSVSVIEQ